MTATWASATSGFVSGEMDYYSEADSSNDLAAIRGISIKPGWTYEFTAEGDGTFELIPNPTINAFSWVVCVNDEPTQGIGYPFDFSTPLIDGITYKIQANRGSAGNPGFCSSGGTFPLATAFDFAWTITEEPSLAPYTLTTWDPDIVFNGIDPTDPASLAIFDATVGITGLCPVRGIVVICLLTGGAESAA